MQTQYISIGFCGQMKKFLSFLFIALAAIVLVACKKVTLTVSDANKTLAMKIGETATITPEVSPAGKTLEWVSSSPSTVAVVAGSSTLSATLTAVAEGSATITVNVVGKPDIKVDITVTVTKSDPTSVTVTGAGVVDKGGTLQLTGAVLPATASQALTWTTSDSAIATVSATGLVTAVGVGLATITATSVADSTKKLAVEVSVVLPKPTEVTITGPTSVLLTKTITLNAVVAPELAVQGVTWTSLDPSIATVTFTGGVVTGVKGGTVVIEAKSTALATVKGQITITVTLPDPTSVVVSGPTEIPLDLTGTYSAVVAPVDASQAVVWSVSDPTLATISQDGVLTPLLEGNVKVIATTVALNTIKAEFDVVLKKARVKADMEISGGYWPITGTDAFVSGTPVVEFVGGAAYNPTALEYYVSATAGAYLTSLFIQDSNYIIPPSVWQNRIFLNRTAEGFFEIQKVIVAGSANANPTLSDYEYVVYAHSGYAAGYNFLATLEVGQLITFNGFDITAQSTYDIGQATFKVYNKADVVLSQALYGPGAETLELPTPGRLGYLFDEWYDNAEYTGSPLTSITESKKVYAKWKIDYSAVVVTPEATSGVIYSALAKKHFVVGETAFTSLAAALAKVNANGKVFIEEGVYDEAVTINKDGLTFTGEEGATLTAGISVDANIKGLTIQNLTFKVKGRLVFAAAGGISDFTFKNNTVSEQDNVPVEGGQSLPSTFIAFTNNGTANNTNFVITNNQFLIGTGGNAVRWIRGGNIENLTVTNNKFEGVPGIYVDAIRIEGNGDALAAGIGVGGVVTISNNIFDKIGQRAVWFRRIAATKIDVINNLFDQTGGATAGGGLQLEQLVPETVLAVNITKNTFQNITHYFGIRIGVAATPNLGTVKINENKFINFTLATAPYIDAYAGVTNVDANGNFFEVAPTATSIKNLDPTAYATSLTTLKVTFNSNGGPAFADVDVPVALVRKAAKPADQARLGYEFGGWYKEAAFTNLYDFDAVVEYPITLYAKWIPIEYDITYNLNGGAFGFAFANKTETINKFMDDFFAFVNPTESKTDFIHGVDKTSGYDGLWHSKYIGLLYAGRRPEAPDPALFISHPDYMDKWLPFFDMMETFIVTVNSGQHFYANGDVFVGNIRIRQYIINAKPSAAVTDATMAMMPMQYKLYVNYNIAGEYPLVAPAKDGHLFMGWFDNAELTGTAITKIPTGSNGAKAFYAKWEESVVVTYKNPDGTLIAINQIIKGSNLANPTDPVKTGYNFVAWFTTAELTTEFTFNGATNADVEIFAKWEEIEYDLAYELNGGSWSWTAETVTAPGSGIDAVSSLPEIFMQDFYQYLKYNDLLQAEPVVAGLQKTNWTDFSKNYNDPRAIYNWCSTATDGGVYSSHTGYSQHFYTVENGAIVGGFFGTEPYKSKYANLANHLTLMLPLKYSAFTFGVEGDAEGGTGFMMDGYFYGTQGAGSGNFAALRGVIPTPYVKYEIVNGVVTAAATEYEILKKMFTAEALLVAPSKEGFLFEGWYTNAEFTGNKVNVVGKNTIPAAKYYAKWKDVRYDEKSVNFDLNGGMLTTYIEATRYSTAGDSVGARITVGTSRGGAYWYVIGLKATATAGIYEVVGKATGYTNAAATLYISYHDGCTSPYKAALAKLYAAAKAGDKISVTKIPGAVTADTSIDVNFLSTGVTEKMSAPGTAFPVALRAGFEFLGWYDNPEFTGSPVASYPGFEDVTVPATVTYYAKWNELVVPGTTALFAEEVGATYSGEGVVLENDTANSLMYVGTSKGLVIVSYYGLTPANFAFVENDWISFSGVVTKTTGGSQARAKHVSGTAETLLVTKVKDFTDILTIKPLVFALDSLTTLDYNLLGSIVTIKVTLATNAATLDGTNYSYFTGYNTSGATRAGFYKVDPADFTVGPEFTVTCVLVGTNNDVAASAIFRFTNVMEIK